MSNQVYANNQEVACKAGAGKSICAFPDVCFTPPENPATPPGVPVPYPNTGMDSDTTDGSRTVQVNGQEVMLKNKSYFKQSMGDEAGCAAKKGVVTSVNRGKVYFIAWSMDVKFEGENVVRNLDMTTHNHASPTSNTPPQIFAARMAMAKGLKSCNDEKQAVADNCPDGSDPNETCPDHEKAKNAEAARKRVKDDRGKDDPQWKRFNTIADQEWNNYAEAVKKNDCQKALRCFLSSYDPSKCCKGQTPHHVVDAASFLKGPEFPKQPRNEQPRETGWAKYDVDAAPCICVEGPNQTTATHGEMHTRQGVVAATHPSGKWTLTEATSAGVAAVQKTFPESNCSPGCLEAQLNRYHENAQTTADRRQINANVEMTSDVAERNRIAAEMGVPSVSTR